VAGYAAIGDSTGGLDDWDDAPVDTADGPTDSPDISRPGQSQHANLAIRGRTTEQIMAEQLPAALGLQPDLVTVVAGMNDLLMPVFDAKAIAGLVEQMFVAFLEAGADVLTFTLPDPTPNLPLTGILQPRVIAFQGRHAAERAGW
jgi:lysophospholipase L1-like esterase